MPLTRSLSTSVGIAVLTTVVGASAARQAPAPTPAIEWRVEAGFAPFSALADPQAVSAKWLPAAPTPGTIESFQQWYHRISDADQSPLADLLTSTQSPWDPTTGRYRQDYAQPERVVILARAPGAGADCQWVASGGAGDIDKGTGRCDNWVRLTAPLVGGRLAVQSTTPIEPVAIAVDHKVVVGVGDSYGSGEGNPDVPSTWKRLPAKRGSYDWLDDPGKKDSLMESGARWWDTPCHRSFWNHQSYVAMRLAAEDPHRLVTFLHYSCAAAEVFDGLMVRQFEPPGMDDDCGDIRASPGAARVLPKDGCYVKESQFAAVVRALCRGQVLTASPKIAALAREVERVANAKNQKLYFMDTYEDAGLDLAECAGQYRVPDLVLVSIGGNDVGFGALAGWAIVPQEARNPFGKLLGVFRLVRAKLTCPDRALGPGCNRPYDVHLIRQLPRRFALMSKALRELVQVTPANVVVTSYPDPLRDRSKNFCGDPKGLNLDSPWAGGHSRLPFNQRDWEFNLRHGEASILGTHTLPNLRRAMEDSAATEGLTPAPAAYDAFLGHCWTEKDPGDSSTALPSARPDEWACPGLPAGSPACWKPFAERRRFIRTLNDTLLTQSSERDDDMSGTVHPSAQGHAAVAEAVLSAVRTTPAFAAKP